MVGSFDPFCPCLYLDGDYVPSAGGERIPVLNPSTLETVGHRTRSTAQEIDQSVAAARRAQKEWAGLDAKSRARHLHQLADRIEKTPFHDVAKLITLEMGKPYPEAEGELANCGPIFRYFAELARHDEGHVAGSTHPHTLEYMRQYPYGVSVHIVPFNFPIILMVWTVAASLAAGNAVLIKPAEATTLSTLKFMKYFSLLPKGLVACLPGDGRVGQQLIEHGGTDVVAFTGGVETGRRVAMSCAAHMKPCVIEAGGSDPLIVSKNCDLDVAVPAAVTAAFHLSGQICVSTERFYVEDAVHDEFVRRFVAATQKLRIGDGLGKNEIGPLVSEAARTRVMELVQQAVTEGATLACGGKIPENCGKGWFYEPTLLTGVTPDMSILKEESFGPVASIIRVQDFEEALCLANDSDFGLGACVFTANLEEAMTAADRLEAGMVWINNPMPDNDALPFGGWKNSGLGRSLGKFGLDSFRQTKMVFMDYKPDVQDWWYPYADDWFYGAKGRQQN
tara:strand:+ start:12602 stop:14119 length:1518 start_codon:yes stop_codon:yes gene_type:complete